MSHLDSPNVEMARVVDEQTLNRAERRAMKHGKWRKQISNRARHIDAELELLEREIATHAEAAKP